jgi:hypothetical protein
MIYNISCKLSDAVEMKVRLCAIPNVEEFLCQVWEIAILIDGRVNMNSAVASTTLHSTPSCNEALAVVPKPSKAPSNAIARSNSPWKSCLLSHGAPRTRRVGEKHNHITEQQYCATDNFCNVKISIVHHSNIRVGNYTG